MATLTHFVLDTCDLDAVIYTDHWGGYNDLGKVGYPREDEHLCLRRPGPRRDAL